MTEALIEETLYNTRWFRAPYARIRTPAFFNQSRSNIADALKDFAVVEYTSPDLDADGVARLRNAGFWRADTQIPFKISLRQFQPDNTPKRLQRLTIKTALEDPFSLSAADLPAFTAERFLQIRGVSEAQIKQRFALWSGDIIAEHPEHCLALFDGDRPIGWFLSRPTSDSTIDLSIAMAHPEAPAMGGLLYEAVHYHFAEAGFRMGQASFSVSNTSVLNIYAGLGAKFLAPRHIWLWQARET